MKEPGSSLSLSYKTPSSIRWCQDCDRVLVVNEETCQATSLTGLDAALWKWFTLSYSAQEVFTFAQEFLQISAQETRDHLSQVINHWVELDLLTMDDKQ
ncbi:MAG: hypothetical protein IH586_09500 [Anaerolineaceae bacterium]|nr:hypothetical protein [Anaerolineaceae bacterium]